MEQFDVTELVKLVSQKHELLTFGYIRTEFVPVMPDLIIQYCLIYAFLKRESFKYFVDMFGAEQDIIIYNDEDDTISNDSNTFQTAYGDLVIDSIGSDINICIWKFKIDNIGTQICIGIDQIKTDWNKTALFYLKEDEHHYAFEFDRIYAKIYDNSDEPKYFSNSTPKNGDIVTIKLDLTKKVIDFYRNEDHIYECKEVKASNDIKYSLAVSLVGKSADDVAMLTLQECVIQAV